MAPLGDSLRRLRDRVFPRDDTQQQQADHALPPLPPCPVSAVTSSPAPGATAHSPLFQRLPAEIRERILVAAFGDQLVHMHLSLERPLRHRRARRGGESSSTWAGHAGHLGQAAFDPAAPPFWRWRSTRCHSSCFDHGSWRRRAPRRSDAFRDRDPCVSGESCGHPGAPGTCVLGATGWLGTCRRAYQEGYPVLYGTNTVRLHGTFMFAYLPELLPVLSLESLTRVSMCWDLGWLRGYPRRLRPGDHPEEYSFVEGLDRLLARLPFTLPHVKCLHISLQGVFGDGEQWAVYGARSPVVYEQTEALLRRVLVHILPLRTLTEFRLALPRSMFMPWVQEVLDITLEFDEAIWAELPAEWLKRDVPTDLLHSDENMVVMDSFWVLLGVSDLPPLTIRCFY
ncbi:hypothetical protein CCM_08631 [Cordyceps militaris CM01]|uniref:Uncharacterized protein n=1 Tax=Cordyceps militaris (strain CM01) TaxID=983644 RepID=G3JRI3_CORMM|nr:uncharacterized protein CCM_08631 [Cordyceps militaris CM01]EGX88586.1 hypothetical protein CCM_08631 [Cordyceps militaris CM01]